MAQGDKKVTLDGLKAVHDYTQGQLGDLKSALIQVQAVQPSSEDNKIWFPGGAGEEIQVPTYAEHLALKNAFDKTAGFSVIPWTEGGYIYTAANVGQTVDLTPRSNASLCYSITDVAEGDQITINGTGSGNAYLWTFVDSSNTVLSKSAHNAAGNNLVLSAPTGAAKLILNTTAADAGECYAGEILKDAMADVRQKAESLYIGDNKKRKMVAGVIRNSGSGWEFITDANHQGDMNCVSVSSNDQGQIVIDYSSLNAQKVISLLVAPDETFAGRGYLCGSSVGRNASYVEVYKYQPVSVYAYVTCQNDGTIQIDSDSVGVSAVTWNGENSRMVITHDAVTAAPPLAQPAVYSTTVPRIFSTSGTSTTLQFINIADGTLATEVSNKLSFRFQRTSATELKLVKQNANDIVASNGNFWFIGIFEV